MSDVNESNSHLNEKVQNSDSGVRPLFTALGIIIVAVIVIFLIKERRPSVHEIGPIHGIVYCTDGKRIVTANLAGWTIRCHGTWLLWR